MHRNIKGISKEERFPCIFNAHIKKLKDFMDNQFLNKKFLELLSISATIEEPDIHPLLIEGHLERAEKVWKHCAHYIRNRFHIILKVSKNNIRTLSESVQINTQTVHNWLEIIKYIKITVGVIIHMSIDPSKKRYSYSIIKIRKSIASDKNIRTAKDFFEGRHHMA